MTTWTIPVSEHTTTTEQASYYEDQYHKVKAERDESARRLNELENSHRILRTKCAQLETFRKKSIDGVVDTGQVAASIGSMSHQEKSSYDDLFKAYDILQRQHRSLITKSKSYLQQIGKQKKDIQTLKLRCGAPRLKNNRASNSETIEVSTADNKGNVERANVDNALAQLQMRLDNAEAQLSTLRSNPLAPESKTDNDTKLCVLESQRELDQSRIQAQAEKLEKILTLHKEYKARYLALKKELCHAQEENEVLEVRVAELEECKEQVSELREHNRFLENKMIEMCKVAEPDVEEKNQRVRVLGQQMGEKQRECELLTNENKYLREKNHQLESQMTKRIGDVRQELDNAHQQCVQKEGELQHASQMLQDQVANNHILQKQLQESTDGLKREMIFQERKFEELSSKAVQRLQRIRMLESAMIIEGTGHPMRSEGSNNVTLNQAGRNNMEIAVHGASLTGLSEGSKSFIIVDFHSYASELSDIASGANPKYDFIVTYEMMEANDGALSHLLAGCSVRVELYVLKEETPPRLFACASVPTSALLNPLAQARSPAVELLLAHERDGKTVGTLNLSMRLARPIHTPPRMMDEVAEGAIASRGQRTVPDAISVSIASVKLSRGKGDDDPFYVHYRFIARDVMTNLARADAGGTISFRHTSSFPILSTDEGVLEPVLWALSKVTIEFILFSGGRRENERGVWEEGGYRIVGRAWVPLNDFWSRTTDTTAEIISPEAKIVGSMTVAFKTNVKPAFDGDDWASRDSMRSSAQSRFVALLTEVVSTIGRDDDLKGAIDAARLLRFIDPPLGILETAEHLRRLMDVHFRDKSLSGVLLLPSAEGTSVSEFVQCTEDARNQGSLPAEFPPDEEMEDLYRHLSGKDGRMCTSDLNYFVVSEAVKTLAATCRMLRRMKRKDIRAMIDGRREANAEIWCRELNDYATELFDSLSDVELIHLSSLIVDLAR